MMMRRRRRRSDDGDDDSGLMQKVVWMTGDVEGKDRDASWLTAAGKAESKTPLPLEENSLAHMMGLGMVERDALPPLADSQALPVVEIERHSAKVQRDLPAHVRWLSRASRMPWSLNSRLT